MISRQLLSALNSEHRIVSNRPELIEAVCDRCASTTMVLSGPPGSEVQRPVVCACGNVWMCTVSRGPLRGGG